MSVGIELNLLERDPCIKWDGLNKISEREFFLEKAMDFSRHSSKKFIDYFNDTRKNRYGYEGVLPAEFSHEYNRIAKDWQRKIITIEYNEDLIIMVLKRVQMFKTVYTRVEGLPISINNNCKNERTVLLKLIEKNLINKISSNSSEAEKLKDWGYTLSEKIDSYNFYSHIPSNCEKISKNKWRTKKGINRMLKMSNLKWKVLKEETDEIEMISKGFDKWKTTIEGTHKGWHKLSKGILKYPFWRDKNTIYYLITYKDIPVGFCVYIINGKLAHQIINKSIGHTIYEKNSQLTNEVEQKEFEEIKKRMGALIHYITVKDIYERGIVDGYFGGAFSMKSLRTYKQILNDVEIPHYVFKWEN